MKGLWVKALICAGGLLWIGPGLSASGEWTMERHNTKRTAYAPGQGDVTEPAVRSRTYLGGIADAWNVAVGDLNQDGYTEIATVVGGKVVVKDPFDRVVWDTFDLRATEISGAYDFDGDDATELLVLGTDGLHILKGLDGEILWHKTDFEPTNNETKIPNTRVLDLNGDQLPDILTKAYWWSDGLVHTYTFERGFNLEAPDANELWRHDIEAPSDGGYFPAIGDVNGDGIPEVVSSAWDILEIFPADTGGAALYRINMGRPIHFGRTEIVNLDDDPQLEIVHYTQLSGKSIEVFDVVRNGLGPTAEVVFPDSSIMATPTHSVVDLDQDGRFEIVVSRFDGSNWAGTIYQYSEPANAGSGFSLNPVATLQDQEIIDLADLDGDGKSEILTHSTIPGHSGIQRYATLRVYGFDSGAPVLKWTLSNGRWHTIRIRGTPALNPTYTFGTLARHDLDQDGIPEFYVSRDDDGDQKGDTLTILSAEGGELNVRASRTMSVGTELSIIWPAYNISDGSSGAEALALDTNGTLWILGPDLETHQSAGMKLGGFYRTTPQAADLDADGVNELIVQKSTGLLSVFDPRAMRQTGGESAVRWSFDGNVGKQSAIAVDMTGDGFKELIVRDNRDVVSPAIQLLSQEGEILETFVTETLPFNLTPGNFLKWTSTDLFGVQKKLDGQYYLFAINGATWDLAWETGAPIQPPDANVNEDTTAAIELTGDGSNDIIFGEDTNLCAADGRSGKSLGCRATKLYSGGIVGADVQGDDALELVLAGSMRLTVLDSSLNEAWHVDRTDEEDLNRNPTVTDADDDGLGEIFISGGNAVYCYETGGSLKWVRPLTGGSAGSEDTNVFLGGLTSGDVDGDRKPELLVGSSDGHLYCLNSLSGEIEWQFELFYAVGDPILADLDGNGFLDIAVTAGDGHLYTFTQSRLSAPAQVRDVAIAPDFTLQDTMVDVESTEIVMRLGAAWDAVPSAAGYLYAVLSDHNTYVVDWTDAGPETAIIITESRLVYGHLYTLLVQAYNEKHEGSPWVRSDGVRIVDESPPEISQVFAEPNPFNPEVDGSTHLHARFDDLTGITGWTIEILEEGEPVLRHTYGAGGTTLSVEEPWDGTDREGNRMPDGRYRFRFSVTDTGSHTITAESEVELTSDLSTPTPLPTPYPTVSSTPEQGPEPTPTSSAEPTVSPLPPTSTPGISPTLETDPTELPDQGASSTPLPDAPETPTPYGDGYSGTESPCPDVSDPGSCQCALTAGDRAENGPGTQAGGRQTVLLLMALFHVTRNRRRARQVSLHKPPTRQDVVSPRPQTSSQPLL